MADLEDGIQDLLVGSAGITAIVGTGDDADIYPMLVPEGFTNYPAVTFQVISETRDPELTKQHGLTQARVQINCWARTYGGAKALKEAVRNAIDGESTTFPQGCFIEGGSDAVEPSPDARSARLFNKSVDAMVWVVETDPTYG